MRRSAFALARQAARAAQPPRTIRPCASPMALSRRPPALSNSLTPVFKRFGSTLPPRSEAYAKATKEHVEHIKSLLSSPNGVMSTLDGSASADDLQPFNDDWMNKYHGKSQIVVKPKTTQEVSEVLKYCNEQGLAVVPQGGNTGLVGTLSCNSAHSCLELTVSVQVDPTPSTMKSFSTSPTWPRFARLTRCRVSLRVTPAAFSKPSTTISPRRGSSSRWISEPRDRTSTVGFS